MTSTSSTSTSYSTTTSSISGLVSGLDTASIVSSLMELAAAPQTLLKTRLSTEKSKLSALQSLNSAMSALASSASALSTSSGWSPITASSSSTGVAVSALTGATVGSYDVTVNSVAAAQKNVYSTAAALTTNVTGSDSTKVKLTINGKTTELDTGNGTMQGLVSALNNSGTGVKATTTKLDDGTYRLAVTSSTTGTSGAFSLTAEDGSDLLGGATTTAASNASVTVNGDTVTSSTNTFNNVLSGLSFTVSSAAVGTNVTLSTALDSSSMGDSVKKLISSVNSVLSNMDALTSTDTTSPGTFSGNVTLTSLRDNLLTTIFGAGSSSSLATYGIETNTDGTIDFDESKFESAYAADPDGTTTAFAGTKSSDGFMDRIYAVANGASNSTGTLTTMVSGENSTISTLNSQISDWTTRLTLEQTTLESKFTAMETAMSKLNTTSSWLTSQITSMENAG